MCTIEKIGAVSVNTSEVGVCVCVWAWPMCVSAHKVGVASVCVSTVQ